MPKCIVHGAGGTLLQHLKEPRLPTDVKPGERLFYFTACGWMMWNWLASGLASGATVVLYEGSSFHPDPSVLWEMAAAEGVTIFGTSPKYLSALEKAGYRPCEHVNLSRLRTVLSTGQRSFARAYRIQTLPTFIAIDASGHVRHVAAGTLWRTRLQAWLAAR